MAQAVDRPVHWVHTGSFPSPRSVQDLLDLGDGRGVLVLQKVLPNASGMRALRAAYEKVVFDLDTAIYASPPELGSSGLLRITKAARRAVLRGAPDASSRRRPLARVLRDVDVCVVGNSELGRFARRFARRTTVIPTTMDPVKDAPRFRPDPPVVVWMGHADSVQYLELIREPLLEVSKEVEFTFRVVSTKHWVNAPLAVEFVAWTRSANREALLSSTVGLSPLPDDAWNRGRSASRLVHYGGHGLPSIASPVGVSNKLVSHGRTGFLASSATEWAEALLCLLRDADLVDKMGRAALCHVTSNYSDAVARDLWLAALEA